MNNKSTDVIIHTSIPLSEDQFNEVAKQVKTIDGVVQFIQNNRHPKIVMVTYNAGKTKALAILNKITRLGFNASLVGI